MKTDKKSPPYLLGLLCLLPLVGALVGIALILYGIFKYKDKKLVLIGVTGILITLTVYFSIFYNMKHGTQSLESYAKLSEIELNSLVKKIEFYKLQKGHYPDNLEILSESDKTVIISDPILLRKMDDNIRTTFQYSKIDNQYTIFSVGIDEVPNTKDDIYPSIISDKLGLIKKPN